MLDKLIGHVLRPVTVYAAVVRHPDQLEVLLTTIKIQLKALH